MGFKTTDSDINEWLNPQSNKSAAVKEAIRAYINKGSMAHEEKVQPKEIIHNVRFEYNG